MISIAMQLKVDPDFVIYWFQDEQERTDECCYDRPIKYFDVLATLGRIGRIVNISGNEIPVIWDNAEHDSA